MSATSIANAAEILYIRNEINPFKAFLAVKFHIAEGDSSRGAAL